MSEEERVEKGRVRLLIEDVVVDLNYCDFHFFEVSVITTLKTKKQKPIH